jgi:hypothetical protein
MWRPISASLLGLQHNALRSIFVVSMLYEEVMAERDRAIAQSRDLWRR